MNDDFDFEDESREETEKEMEDILRAKVEEAKLRIDKEEKHVRLGKGLLFLCEGELNHTFDELESYLNLHQIEFSTDLNERL